MIDSINFQSSINKQGNKPGEVKLKLDENGNPLYIFKDANNAHIEGIGTVSGNAVIGIGITNSEKQETMYVYHHEGDDENLFEIDNTNGVNINITGENANVESESGYAQRLIQVDAKNSSIDLTKSGGAQMVVMGEDSKDNEVNLGRGGDYYVDAGKFNKVTDMGGNNTFTTEKTSFGAVIQAGKGDDNFFIGGDYAVIDGGAGNDTFETVGVWVDDAINSPFRNIIMGGEGNDTLKDSGGYNFFYDNNGKNTYISNGAYRGLAFLGKDSDGTAELIDGKETYVFTSLTEKANDGLDSTFDDVMKGLGWYLGTYFGGYSQISQTDTDCFANRLGIFDKEMLDNLYEAFKGEFKGENPDPDSVWI